MSLKAFHILFITISALLALGFGGWCLQFSRLHGDRAYLGAGIVSFVTAGVLAMYGTWFWHKLKRWEDDVAKSKTSPLRGAPGSGRDAGPRTAPHTGV
jgi:hypothetical protein